MSLRTAGEDGCEKPALVEWGVRWPFVLVSREGLGVEPAKGPNAAG